MQTFLKILVAGIAVFVLTVGSFFIWLRTTKAEDETVQSEKVVWGVDFSKSQAEYLGLNSRETYSAIIGDLGVRHIKIHINWNDIEKEKGSYDWNELDWQVAEAEKNHVKLILVIGLKTGRWPECHTPTWLSSMDAPSQQQEVTDYVSTLTNRYKNSKAVEYWQVENEPFIKFGKCPSWYYGDETKLLEKEVAAVKAIDPSRKVIVSDSGELSTWSNAAKIGDMVGITMYRSSWKPGLSTFGINPYAFLSPEFYIAKAAFIQKTYGKQVICIELQAEPWASRPLAEASLSEMEKSMNPQMFDENIAFAKETNLKAFYFWGVEWWYAMKVKHDKPELWDKAKILFSEQ